MSFAVVLGAVLALTLPVGPASASAPLTIGVGSHPYGLAMSHDDLFVVNQGGQYLGSVSLAAPVQKRNPSQSIALPSQVAVSPDGKTAYVTGQTTTGDGFVSVVDTASLAVTSVIQVGQNPRGLAVSPNGDALYVANKASNSVALIALPSVHLVRYISVGSEPTAVAFSPFGDFVYIANLGGNSVSVVSTDSQSVVATVPVGHSPAGIAVSSDGLLAYTANESDGTMSSIDTRSRQSSSFRIGGSPWALALSPATNRAYVSDASKHSVMVVDLRTHAVTTTVATPGTPGILVVDPTGTLVYVTDIDAGSITLLMVPYAAAPKDDTSKVGSHAGFHPQISNAPAALSWQLSADKGKTWHNVAGANSESLDFTATKAESGNLYRLDMKDPNYGEIFSPPAGLTVTGADGGGTANNPASTPGSTATPGEAASGDFPGGAAATPGLASVISGVNWILVALVAVILLAIALAIILIVVMRRRAGAP
jgi:YVTN family beta-propeller protein